MIVIFCDIIEMYCGDINALYLYLWLLYDNNFYDEAFCLVYVALDNTASSGKHLYCVADEAEAMKKLGG